MVVQMDNRESLPPPAKHGLSAERSDRSEKQLVQAQLIVSVIIPTRNERGTIADAVRRTPEMLGGTEIIFVDGNSCDGTADEIVRVAREYPQRRIRLIEQGSGRGKGDAVRRGFDAASGDVLAILDGDLTVAPESLPQFVEHVAADHADLVVGSRFDLPMEPGAMRPLNNLGNRFFAWWISRLIRQRLSDALCGTKVLRRSAYQRVVAVRSQLGELDPFGDFDLLFGARLAGMRIDELPVSYAARRYGQTNIRRFRDGWRLMQMCRRMGRVIRAD